jgi:hypothetical protein
LLDGKVPDPGTMMRGLFKARFVFCQKKTVIDQLDADPSFVRLFPPDNPLRPAPEKMPYLFEVRPQPDAFVTRVDGAILDPLPSRTYVAVDPHHPAPRALLEEATSAETRSVFVDLFAHAPPAAPSAGEPQSRCAVLAVRADDIALHRGATLLGVGGGRSLRVWLNGEPLFRSDGVYPVPRALNVLVPLPRPLDTGDRVEAVVCSSTAASYMGVAFSFWTRDAVESLCARKRPPAAEAMPDPGAFAFTGVQRNSCLAPWAVASP